MASLLRTASRSLTARHCSTGLAIAIESVDALGNNLQALQARDFSTRPSAAKSSKGATQPAQGYFEGKRAAKDRRRVLFEAKQERLQKIASRRSGRPRDEKRREFREWFIRRKVNEEYMERKARQAGLGWNHKVAVLLERPAIVLPDMEPWEEDFYNLEAHLSQFGKLYPKEFLEDADDSSSMPMTQEELLQFLPKGYTPAPRETEADASGNVRTVDRKLKTSIYLLLQQNGNWQLPTIQLQNEETLVDAAKRAMDTMVGSQLEFWCPSNAPFAVDMTAGSEGNDSTYGTKTFFLKVQYDEGDIVKDILAADDFAWLERSEVVDRVRQERDEDAARFYQYML
jgi:large subunit ribosomal protein L46